MIDFRYHVVSIVAVFLALALGLFVGSTTLQSTVTDQLSSAANSVRADNKALESQNDGLRGQLKAMQNFDAAAEPDLVRGQLTGQTVAVVSAPGVNGKQRSALVKTLQESGAAVSADVRLAPAYLDPDQAAELGQLAVSLNPGHAATDSGVDLASQTLADVLGVRPGQPASSDARLRLVLQALSDGRFLSVNGTARPATLAVLLVPGPDTSTTSAVLRARCTDLVALGHDLDTSAIGAVIAGPTLQAGQPDGELVVIRSLLGSPSSAGVSTVDAVDAPYGRVATVLALAQQRDGGAGSYGLHGSAPLPSPAASSTP